VAKRMLERTVKQKNKYKNDLDVCRNENHLLKMQLEAMKKKIDEMNRINSTFVTNVSTAYRQNLNVTQREDDKDNAIDGMISCSSPAKSINLKKPPRANYQTQRAGQRLSGVDSKFIDSQDYEGSFVSRKSGASARTTNTNLPSSKKANKKDELFK
jgi:hypothetical protein